MIIQLQPEVGYIVDDDDKIIWESPAPPGHFYRPVYFIWNEGITHQEWTEFLYRRLCDFDGLTTTIFDD